jgi:hypothetical protein
MTSLMLSLVIYSAVIFHVTIDGSNILTEIFE